MNRLKTFRDTALALACTLLAFSCSSDDSGTLPAGEYPLTFIASVEQQLTRSSSGNTWDGGEEIAVKIGSQVKEYTAAANGTLTAKNGIDPFYWQSQAETKSVEAWYPYSITTPSSWSVQSDQSAGGYQQSDFLYAPVAAISFSARNTTSLPFYHQTAKVVINIINGDAATSASVISSMKIGDANNLALSGDYATPTGNATQGTWSDLSTFSSITPKEITTTGTFLKSYAALVIPQDMAGEKFIAVALSNGNTYYYTPNTGDATLEGGKQYTYNITVKNTGITVSVGDITDWTGTADLPIGGGAGIWKVGDYYPDPKVDLSNPTEKAKIKGVVFWVDPSDSRHGKVVGLQEKSGVAWSNSLSSTNAINMANGRANMKTIYGLSADFSGYPAFAWVHSLNDANENYSDADATGVWYLPAKAELQYLYCAWNGKAPAIWGDFTTPGWLGNATAQGHFNAGLTAAGGTALGGYYYWSSSEYDMQDAWDVNFSDGLTFHDFKNSNYLRARCVLAF